MEWLILIAGLANLYLGILVLWKTKSSKNFYFGLFVFTTVVLILLDFVFRFYPTLFILKSAYAFAGLVAPFAFLWVVIFLKERVTKIIKTLIVLPGLFLFLVSYFDGYIIKEIDYLTILGFKGLNGPLFIFYSLVIAIYLLLTIIFLYKGLKEADGLLKTQIKYIIAGIVGYGFAAVTFSLILPTFFGIYDLTLLDAPSSLIFVAFTTYAIVKYRLMNIRLVIARSILYTILVGGVASFFALSVFLAGTYLRADSLGSNIITYLISSSIVVIFLDPVKKVFAKITDGIFYKDKVDYQKLLRDASNVISREIDLKVLLNNLNNLLNKELKILGSTIVVIKNNNFDVISKAGKFKTELNISSQVLDYFRSNHNLLVTEELMRKSGDISDEQEKNKFIIKSLEENNIEMVVPVVEKDQLNALFLFGNKLSGDVYSNEDIDFFTVLAPQVATAIEKSKLYEEVQELNLDLQAKVEEKTKNLRQANLDLEARNKFLTTMQAIINMIGRTFDLNKVNQLIADAIASQLGYIGGILSFVDEEYRVIRVGALTRNELTIPAISMLSQDVHNYESQLKEDFNLGAKTVLTGRIHFASDMKEFFSPPVDGMLIDKVQEYLQVKTIVSVPIFSEDKIIGLIHYFMKVNREDISALDIEMMTALASQVGIVSRNLKLYGNLEKVNKELHEANLHLKALDKAKSEFLSIASHQLRTPISAVKGYLSMVLEGDFGPISEPIKKVVKDVFESAARLARVINVFLNVSRIEAGRLKIEKQPTQIVDMIDSVIKELIQSAKQKNLELDFVKPAETPLIFADPDKLREVVLNLVDNAIKYTPQGAIKIYLEFDDKTLTFISKDTGIGIHPYETQNLFRKFVRGDGVAQIHTGGSGLGLFIAQKIIKEHEGNIWVESEGKGKGSTFKFTVPLATAEDIRVFNKNNKSK